MSIGPEGRDQATFVRGAEAEQPARARAAPRADRSARTKRRAQARTAQAALATPTARIAHVAGAQWGVIGMRQLRDCGVSKSTVARWASEGRLHRRYDGVYTVGHRALPVEGELTAALLAAGPGAMLSHATAAWWWGLTDDQPSIIDISVPSRRHAPPPGLKFHHPAREFKRTWHRRLPITPVIQTLLDFAAGAPLYQVRFALAQADYLGRVEIERVRTALGPGRPGSARLRAAVENHLPELARTRSRLEQAFLLLCEATGLPMPEVNTTACGFLVDAVWREQRVVVELDGVQGHRTAAQLESDHERDLGLRQNRFETRRYTWQQVTRKPHDVFADLPSAVRALTSGNGPYQR